MRDGSVLVVAATPLELQYLHTSLTEAQPTPIPGWHYVHEGKLAGQDVLLVASGVGKSSIAAAIAAVAARNDVTACINVGIAGAYVGAFLPVGMAVAAEREIDIDAGILTMDEDGVLHTTSLSTVPLSRGSSGDKESGVFEVFPTDPAWTRRLGDATRTSPQVFATSDAISGDLDVAARRFATTNAGVESMEGVGAAIACHHLGIPFAELRGISNIAGIRDKSQWQVDVALKAMSRALLTALQDV